MSKTYTVRLNNDEKFIEEFAEFQGVTVAKLLKDTTIEHIEDLIDIRCAEEELDALESNQSSLMSWEEFINE